MVHSQPKTEKRLFTEQEAADYLGMSRSYLRQDRMNGPQFKNSQDSEFCRPLGRPQGRRTGCTSDKNSQDSEFCRPLGHPQGRRTGCTSDKNSQDSEFCRPLGHPQGRRTGCTSDKNSQDSEFCRPLGHPQGRRTGSTSDKNRTPGPDYCRFGTMIRYTKEALDKWIDDNLITRVND